MIRIYSQLGKNPTAVDTSRIEGYKTHVSRQVRYFTDRGIFELDGNHIREILVKEGEIKLADVKIGEHTVKLMFDLSNEFLSDEKHYQLPIGYIRQCLEITSYRIAEHAQPRLVVLKDENGTVVNYYIDTTMSPDCPEVLQTVATFLLNL